MSGLSLTDAHCRSRSGQTRIASRPMGHHEGEQIVDVTIEAVRDRFHTLNVPMAYFDGPAGTQVLGYPATAAGDDEPTTKASGILKPQ